MCTRFKFKYSGFQSFRPYGLLVILVVSVVFLGQSKRLMYVEYFVHYQLCSVPDLSEYRVWLGVLDIGEGAPDWSKRQEVNIADVICGPEGSSLALIRLSK